MPEDRPMKTFEVTCAACSQPFSLHKPLANPEAEDCTAQLCPPKIPFSRSRSRNRELCCWASNLALNSLATRK